jgi:hypothetical protein
VRTIAVETQQERLMERCIFFPPAE